MKKFLLIFAAVVLTAFSADVFAQGTGVAPAVGSIHNYSVAPTTANGNTYTWLLTTDANGLVAAGAGIATLSSSGGVDVSDIDITWVAPVIGTTYYLHVVETATVANGGCSNHKALAIKPANLFALQIENYELTDAKDTIQDYSICAAEVLVQGFNGSNDGSLSDAQDFTYNYQKDSVYYRIYPTGINTTNTAWNAAVSLTYAAGGTATYFYSTNGTNYNAVPVSGVIPVSEGNDEVFVKVVINNSTTYEGTVAKNVTLTLGAASEDENGNDATSLGNISRNQIVKARPATSAIGTTD